MPDELKTSKHRRELLELVAKLCEARRPDGVASIATRVGWVLNKAALHFALAAACVAMAELYSVEAKAVRRQLKDNRPDLVAGRHAAKALGPAELAGLLSGLGAEPELVDEKAHWYAARLAVLEALTKKFKQGADWERSIAQGQQRRGDSLMVGRAS
ncbi:hypothetical protein [Kutzneria kofuensis]|uniref:Uncharacterized protein n=1 Tax=Kutzneria kofuensis TaxID=103725 RepID=A0A7W9NI25_9PSEU|nr:hypothetical protein [Kutzneria kofuensis]MBB5892786.1 hypothetical protein [Kutzneria kofuensis]MBB5893184.1 hypothetical protein [Kutzneria kofuensis]